MCSLHACIPAVTYLRNEIFLKLKRDGSLPRAREPRHPNRAPAKSSNGADRLSPFYSGHIMCLRQHVGRYHRPRLCEQYDLSAFLSFTLCRILSSICNQFLSWITSLITSFGESEISRIGRTKIPIFRRFQRTLCPFDFFTLNLNYFFYLILIYLITLRNNLYNASTLFMIL